MTPVSLTRTSDALPRSAPLVRTTRVVCGADEPFPDPAQFLAAFEGRPRGFWGRGERWVAWGDVLDELVVGSGGAAAPAGEGESRFEVARRWAEERGAGAGRGGGEFSPRLFGGFSFLEDPEANGSWSAFPPARFVLPRVLLEAGPEGVGITVLGRGAGPASSDAVSAPADAVSAPADAGPAPTDARPAPTDAVSGDAARDAEAETWVRSLRSHPGAGSALDPTEPFAADGEAAEERGEDGWTRAVERVLAAERDGQVDKAVLARTRDVTLPVPVSVPRLLRFLRHENSRAHVFVFEPEPGSVLFGAAPEVLAELRGGRFHATAVAGSAPRGRTTHEEQLFAGGLLASPKDRAEHRMTVEEMVEVLTPRMRRLEVPSGPGVLKLARIQHLESPIEGEAADGQDILSLVEALHPTPAVCGRPRAAALELIRAVEPFERGWYAGPVGWFDIAGDGDFVPALRIGVGGGRRWRLYAGAGIVEGSDPHSEWEETALKFEPAHRALRASGEGS